MKDVGVQRVEGGARSCVTTTMRLLTAMLSFTNSRAFSLLMSHHCHVACDTTLNFLFLNPSCVASWSLPRFVRRELHDLNRTSWSSGNSTDSYSGGPVLNHGPQTIEVFSCFLSVPPGKFRDSTLQSGHDRFLPHPFQFIIYLSCFHSTLYGLSYLKSVDK
jgi:hypothetical protein